MKKDTLLRPKYLHKFTSLMFGQRPSNLVGMILLLLTSYGMIKPYYLTFLVFTVTCHFFLRQSITDIFSVLATLILV